jgi:hypothetical protein
MQPIELTKDDMEPEGIQYSVFETDTVILNIFSFSQLIL